MFLASEDGLIFTLHKCCCVHESTFRFNFDKRFKISRSIDIGCLFIVVAGLFIVVLVNSFSFMDPPPSSLTSTSKRRSYISTGSTPNKPSEKRQRHCRHSVRKPLDFSGENVENVNESQSTDLKSSLDASPRHRVSIWKVLIAVCSIFLFAPRSLQ